MRAWRIPRPRLSTRFSEKTLVMATALHAFTNHEFGTIRTITSGGQVLFYGKDVATVLGYANTKDALVRHCKGA